MADDLVSKFTATAERYPEREAVRYKEQENWASMTYAELREKAEALSRFLEEEGVKKGDNIAIMLANSPYWPIVFFAVCARGAVAIPVSIQAGTDEIDTILEDSRPVMAFANKDSYMLQEEAAGKHKYVKKAVNVDSSQFNETLRSRRGSGLKTDLTGAEDLACILYTSGTTGAPKGVMLSHGNFIANCASLNKLQIIKDDDRVISMLPLHHAYPLNITMILPLLYGSSIVYPRSIRREDVFEAINAGKVTVFVAVPQFYHALHKKITDQLKDLWFPLKVVLNLVTGAAHLIKKSTGMNAARFVLRSLHKKFGPGMRLFATGGAKLDENVLKDLLRFGFTISEGYGLSETAPVLTFNPPDRPKPGSAGTVIPNVEVKISDPDKDGVGEVIARGPNIMKGYYKRDDLTEEVIKDGWFHTGDLGFFDKDGYLFLTGRSKDIIVLSSGLNINPSEIEDRYMKNAPIKEICVFEAPSPKGVKADFVLWAVVRPDLGHFKKYGEVNLKNVLKEKIDDISKTLPTHSRIMGFSITLKELPRTALGKLKRFQVKEEYIPRITSERDSFEQEQNMSDEDRELMISETAQKVITALKKHFDIEHEISPGDSLEIDLGIDSLGRVELASSMEKVFRIKIKDEVIARAFSVKDLILEIEALFERGEEEAYEGWDEAPRDENYWRELFRTPPEKENLNKIDLSPGFLSWIGGFLFLLPFHIMFKLFYRLRVEGTENIKGIERHILYANHTSYFDGLVIGSSFPGFPRLDMFFIGFRPYFNVIIIRSLIKIGRIIPIDFSSHLTEALRSCYYVLEKGRNLCIFPEGMRTNGEIKEFKKGFAILAKESGAKLVPVLLEGSYEAWPRTSKFPKRHPIKVTFGKAMNVDEAEKIGREAGLTDSYEAVCAGARKTLLELRSQGGK
jgi:long-chain acyl-CoA synthetase